MGDENGTWGDYSKLVLKELERLNENHEKMRTDFDNRLNELTSKISQLKSLDVNVESHAKWIDKVSDVWSPSQMKEAKDELYQQKNRWIAAIAILGFAQVLLTVAISIWSKLK